MLFRSVRQQFGWTGPLVATLGLARLFSSHWRRGLLMLTLYVTNVLFAYSYNVGDAHVFYLPSHLCVALLVAPGIVKGTGIFHGFCVRRGLKYAETANNSGPLLIASVLLVVLAQWQLRQRKPSD